jgi:hypothetical protein
MFARPIEAEVRQEEQSEERENPNTDKIKRGLVQAPFC